MFVWLWLVVNDRKFPAGTLFFSHTNQSAVFLHEPTTIRTSQPNRLIVTGWAGSTADQPTGGNQPASAEQAASPDRALNAIQI